MVRTKDTFIDNIYIDAQRAGICDLRLPNMHYDAAALDLMLHTAA